MGVCPAFLSVAKTATLTKRDCGVGAVLVSPYTSRSQSLNDKVHPKATACSISRLIQATSGLKLYFQVELVKLTRQNPTDR